MPVNRFLLSSNRIDGDLSVLARIAAVFAPHESDPVSLAIVVDAGHLVSGGDLIETRVQLVNGFTVPNSAPRIDRVVVDATGLVFLVNGIEAANPKPPAIPAGTVPVAQVLVHTSTIAITNEMIIDERDFSGLAQARGTVLTVKRFTSSGFYTPTPGTTGIIVELVGGGGSGGSCAAPDASQGSAAGGGSSGAFARARLTSGLAGVAVTVGTGGVAPGAGANVGNAGTASSFGSLITCAPGGGGSAGGAYVAPVIAGGANSPPPPTNANLVAAAGGPGQHGYLLSQYTVVGGNGGYFYYGGGGNGGGNNDGFAAQTPGGGGGGASSISGAPARQGGAGASGMVTIYEFS